MIETQNGRKARMQPRLKAIMGIMVCALAGLLAGCVTQTPAAGSPVPASVTPPAATATTADLPPASTPAPTPTTPAASAVTETSTPLPAATPTLLPSATPTPLPSLTPTSAPSATLTAVKPTVVATPTAAGQSTPRVIRFSVAPTTTLNLGDPLVLSWEAVGEKASVCFIGALGPSECRDVPLSGQLTLISAESAIGYNGLTLRAAVGQVTAWSTVGIQLQCQNLRAWFFAHHPQRCPAAAAVISAAALQTFEAGFMVWTANPDRFYVFFAADPQTGQGQEFVMINAPYTFLTPAPFDATPPPGAYEPVSGFGQLWRGEIEALNAGDLRTRLGWATAPESSFESAYQCDPPSHPRLWRCYLRLPGDRVLSLRPDSSAQVRLLWQEW